MAKRMLYNRKNGVTLPYSKALLKNNPEVVELTEEGDDPIEEVDATEQQAPAYNGESIIVEKATKQELVDFAANHYGESLNKRDAIETLREQVRNLIEAAE